MKSAVLLTIACTLTLAFWTGFAFSQSVIKVTGSKDDQMIKEQVELFLNHLDVQETLHLTIIFSTKMPERLKGITISDPSPEPDKYQLFRVLIDARLNRAKQLRVLAHEMIHVKQYAKKELKILDDRRVNWKKKEYFTARGPNRDMPWEDEAYHGDLILVRQVKSSQKQMQEVLAGQLANRTSNNSSKCIYWSGKCAGKTKMTL